MTRLSLRSVMATEDERIMREDLMTDEEHHAMELTGSLFNYISKNVIGPDPASRSGDVRELVIHIHGIQRMLMAQAACRAFPDKYRLLGERIAKDEEVEDEVRG